MKIFVYSCRSFDEEKHFDRISQQLGVEIYKSSQALGIDNAELAGGCEYVSVLTTPVPPPVIDKLAERGVKMISTRTVGYDHIDCEHAKKRGISVSNVSYNPECVAEYSIMLMLMSLRKTKRIMQRAEINDFTLKGINGALLRDKTVGVIGTGSIGKALIENLKGFGCRIYAYDLYKSDIGIEYLELDELLRRCDLISLHAPLTSETYHLIDGAAIEKMPDGVVIVNTARGGLIDSEALISALERGKVGACGLDVVENEAGLYYNDRRSAVINNHLMSILRDMPNVIVSPHMAFYTDRSVTDMVRNSLLSCVYHKKGVENPWQIV